MLAVLTVSICPPCFLCLFIRLLYHHIVPVQLCVDPLPHHHSPYCSILLCLILFSSPLLLLLECLPGGPEQNRERGGGLERGSCALIGEVDARTWICEMREGQHRCEKRKRKKRNLSTFDGDGRGSPLMDIQIDNLEDNLSFSKRSASFVTCSC